MTDNTDQITRPFYNFSSRAYKSREKSENATELTGHGPFYSFTWETYELLNSMVSMMHAKIFIRQYLESIPESMRREAQAELTYKIRDVRAGIENIVDFQEDHLRRIYPLTKGTRVYTAETDRQWSQLNNDKLLKEAPGIIKYFDELQSFLFAPNPAGIEKFIRRNRKDDFIENEIILHKESFINNSGKWNFNHGKIADWQCYISLIKRKFLKDTRGNGFSFEEQLKQFWIDRYGIPNKNYLKDSQTSEDIDTIRERLNFLIIPE